MQRPLHYHKNYLSLQKVSFPSQEMVLSIDELDISADQYLKMYCSVQEMKRSFTYYQKRFSITVMDKDLVLSCAVLIEKLEKNFEMHGETNYGYEEPNARKTY